MTSYEEFLQKTEDFMFISNQPEKADIIFIPGNGYPHMAENAADLYKRGFAPYILPSGKYSIPDRVAVSSRCPYAEWGQRK